MDKRLEQMLHQRRFKANATVSLGHQEMHTGVSLQPAAHVRCTLESHCSPLHKTHAHDNCNKQIKFISTQTRRKLSACKVLAEMNGFRLYKNASLMSLSSSSSSSFCSSFFLLLPLLLLLFFFFSSSSLVLFL